MHNPNPKNEKKKKKREQEEEEEDSEICANWRSGRGGLGGGWNKMAKWGLGLCYKREREREREMFRLKERDPS